MKTRSTATPTGATRAMFTTPPTMSMMMRGPMVAYDTDDGASAGGKTAEELAAEASAAEAAAEAERLAAEAGAGTEDDDDDVPPAKPTDAEAKLLREQMKTKKALKVAKDAEQAAKDALAAYKGADPAKVASLLAAEAEAERKQLEAKGEYDRILAQVNEQNDAALAAKDTELQSTRDELTAARAQIDELTVGNDFANSKFLSDETVLSPAKARRLYGDHFEVVDGKTVGYDKPKGGKDRTVLVDAKGEPLSFNAAIEKIVKADEDFERIAKSKMKPGSGSNPGHHKVDETPNAPTTAGVGRIAANIGKLAVKDPKAK
jgi:hypothetical protein